MSQAEVCVLSFDYIKGTPGFPSGYAFSLTKEVGYLYLYYSIQAQES